MAKIFDFTLQDRRIKLIHTDDPWTKLKPSDMGTITCTFDNLDDTCIVIEWDSGSTLSLVEGKDEYEILNEERELEEE